MKLLLTCDRWITEAAKYSVSVIFMIMLGLAVMQVLLRVFFNAGLLWGDIAARSLVLWVGFLGALLATRANGHFHIDVLTKSIGVRLGRRVQGLSNIFAATICCVLCKASVTFLELDEGGKSFLNIPIQFVEIILPISFCIMAVQFLIRASIEFIEGSRISSSSSGKKAG